MDHSFPGTQFLRERNNAPQTTTELVQELSISIEGIGTLADAYYAALALNEQERLEYTLTPPDLLVLAVQEMIHIIRLLQNHEGITGIQTHLFGQEWTVTDPQSKMDPPQRIITFTELIELCWELEDGQ